MTRASYFGVAFPQHLETEKAKELRGLVVAVTVNEGDTYDLGEVRWRRVARSAKELIKDWRRSRSGDLANFDDVTAVSTA